VLAEQNVLHFVRDVALQFVHRPSTSTDDGAVTGLAAADFFWALSTEQAPAGLACSLVHATGGQAADLDVASHPTAPRASRCMLERRQI
jgi:hypothetical protein